MQQEEPTRGNEGVEPTKGFAWSSDPWSNVPTKESRNLMHSLAAGMQDKVAKLSSATKECSLTSCHLFNYCYLALVEASETAKVHPTAASLNCFWLRDPPHLCLWLMCQLELVFATLGLSDFHGSARLDPARTALMPSPAHLKWELMLLLIHLGCLCSPEYFWWLLGNYCWIHAWGINCMSTLKEENSLKLRTLPYQK